MRRFGVAANLRRHHQPEVAPAKLRQADRAAAAILLVGLAVFALADFLDGPREVAVPFQSVHGEVEMGVEEEHGELVE
jgi:hypothetical protein